MLKITLHDGADAFRFALAGKLAGAWVDELSGCWQTASSTFGQKAVIVDLKDMTFADETGQQLLRRMFREGARFLANSPYQREIVTDITGQPVPVERLKPARKCLKRLIGVILTGAIGFVLFNPFAVAQERGVLRLTLKQAVDRALKH